MSSNMERTIGGFIFGTDEEAEMAKKDEEKISFIESRIDWSKPGMTQIIYNKAIQNMIFETPVGYTYLSNMKQRLQEGGAEDVFDIPLNHGSYQQNRKNNRKRIEPSKVVEIKKKFGISVLMNGILGIIVIAMFVITLKGNNPNILNYENVLIDKYASWEQELTEREAIVREKERELIRNEP